MSTTRTTDCDSLLAVINSDFEIIRGRPLPLGATLERSGVNFAVYSRHATFMALVVYKQGGQDPLVEFPLDPHVNRTGDIWHAFLGGMDPGVEYGWRADGPSRDENSRLRFDRSKVLIDPYARALTPRAWATATESGEQPKQRSLIVDQTFDWGMDRPLNRHLAESVIYELHVRGFTRHPTSGVGHPGTFLGVIDKIPHLKELGITAVELLPVTDFLETHNPRVNPLTGDPLCNFWGYDPINFFAPKSSYASRQEGDAHVREFKTMVKALHEAEIEVILDVVFNHTAEGNDDGQILGFKGLDNDVYYILDRNNGSYHNYSGCGNTLNCNHPIVRNMIIASLRHWVTEMHVDGFRFDLASVLGRGRDGSVLSEPPLLERIAGDPVLAHTKLIAEAWDAAGLYQVGSFPNWGRWAEWNGKFRDDVRSFVKGDPGMASSISTRLCGSPDLYQSSLRTPCASINFITSHDGFTLNDLVSYNAKHNEANGEANRDGDNHNLSWNCGEEGPSTSPRVIARRKRQMRNLATILLLSRGVPMIVAGDEFGRSQNGNNNAYCQDNEIGWINWDDLNANDDLFRFFRELIRFRKAHPSLRARDFRRDRESQSSIEWHGQRLNQPDWSATSRLLCMHIKGCHEDDDILVISNNHWEEALVELPACTRQRRWLRFIDTGLESPADISEVGQELPLPQQRDYRVGSRATVVLVGR